MSDTLPRLRLVPVDNAGDLAAAAAAVQQQLAEVTELAVSRAVSQSSRPVLTPPASLRLDQAELFLLSLDTEMLAADMPRTAYLLGLAESHLANMIALLRAVTT